MASELLEYGWLSAKPRGGTTAGVHETSGAGWPLDLGRSMRYRYNADAHLSALIAEVDEDKDGSLDYSEIMADPLPEIKY